VNVQEALEQREKEEAANSRVATEAAAKMEGCKTKREEEEGGLRQKLRFSDVLNER